MSWYFLCSVVWDEKWLFVLLILVELQFFLLDVLLCVFMFWVMYIMISAWKWCSVRLYLQLFVGGLMTCLPYLFSDSGIQHILCCVFVLFFFVWCTQCCQFLWIVHSWLALRYSLMFIYRKNRLEFRIGKPTHVCILEGWLVSFWCLTPLSAIFQLYQATSFSGGRSRSTRREPPTMGK